MKLKVIVLILAVGVCFSIGAETRQEHWIMEDMRIAAEMKGDKVYEEWVEGCAEWLFKERMKEFQRGMLVYGETPEEIRANVYDYCRWHTYHNFKYLEEYRPDNGGYLFKGYYRPRRETP